jgi:hypothetical protein
MSRGHIELVHAPEIAEQDWVVAGWPAQPRIKILSSDPGTGALTGLVRLPAGYRRPIGFLAAESELIVLEGSLRVGETMRDFGYYEYAPAGTTQAPWSTETGATLLFFARDRAPEFAPHEGPRGADGRIEIDSELLPWTQSPIPGPSEGLLHKTLRLIEETGEMTVLVSNPPFITHGPFYSETGALMLVWVPSSLVNHVPASVSSTPEENLADFVAAGGARVMREAVAG